ncbi:type VI secretion system tube protein TssD [Flavobacterium sp. '19STA2R22 D10 B1']|uniref:type VI secretion system tube protein TssD n=1 Tax=Flavobacterium aerium TaxID=3037261 RepID=UPI00278C6A19|nr:type VI secretion system tube protein TssD [Flavobacterium sp. '19STA2R22 D10 B1']
MSFLAKLEIDGIAHTVLEYDIFFEQNTDNNGKPSSNAKGGKIRVVVEANNLDNFSDWMVSNTQTKDGVITFYKRDAMSRMKEVKFTKGYCIRYHEMFRANGASPMTIEILISSQEINIGNTPFKNKWPGVNFS